MKPLIVLFIVVAICACSTPPERTVVAPPPRDSPPAPSAASERADALIADMAKREAAYKKEEADIAARARLTQLPATDTTPPVGASVRAPTVVSQAPVATSAAPAAVSSVTAGHDESWWKNEMRTAEVRATEDARRLQEAIDTQDRARSQMSAAVGAGSVVFAQAQEAYNRALAEVQRLQAEVRNDNAAVERVREDARRADVPPGWLRWP